MDTVDRSSGIDGSSGDMDDNDDDLAGFEGGGGTQAFSPARGGQGMESDGDRDEGGGGGGFEHGLEELLAGIGEFEDRQGGAGQVRGVGGVSPPGNVSSGRSLGSADASYSTDNSPKERPVGGSPARKVSFFGFFLLQNVLGWNVLLAERDSLFFRSFCYLYVL